MENRCIFKHIIRCCGHCNSVELLGPQVCAFHCAGGSRYISNADEYQMYTCVARPFVLGHSALSAYHMSTRANIIAMPQLRVLLAGVDVHTCKIVTGS